MEKRGDNSIMKKISDYASLDGMRIMGKITLEAKELLKNPEIIELFDGFKNIKGKKYAEIIVDLLNAVFNIAPKNILNIIAYVDDVKPEIIYEQPFIKTFDDIMEIAEDKDLVNFLSRVLGKNRKTSSDTSPNAGDMIQPE